MLVRAKKAVNGLMELVELHSSKNASLRAIEFDCEDYFEQKYTTSTSIVASDLVTFIEKCREDEYLNEIIKTDAFEYAFATAKADYISVVFIWCVDFAIRKDIHSVDDVVSLAKELGFDEDDVAFINSIANDEYIAKKCCCVYDDDFKMPLGDEICVRYSDDCADIELPNGKIFHCGCDDFRVRVMKAQDEKDSGTWCYGNNGGRLFL